MNNFLPKNLFVEKVHLGGKTIDEALALLDELEQEQLKRVITVSYDMQGSYEQHSTFTYAQLGYYTDKASVIKALTDIMDKNKSIINRFITYKRIENSRADYWLSHSFDYSKFTRAIAVFDDTKLKAPLDAKYSYGNGKVEIIPEEDGFVFDKERLYKELIANKDAQSIKLNVKAVKALVTAKQLETQGVRELISSFTTKFDAGNIPRSSNIRLAAKFIDGALVPPGGNFSFNETVGERTESKGFREAGVYINGKVDTGIGGGICQVSTTLYNSVLLADLPVVERSNHSLTVPYVPLSRDAAVSWGSQDFKFSNNTEHYILIHCRTTNNTITFELYGTKGNKTVELISTTLSKTRAPVQYINDETQPFGKEEVIDRGHDGFQSQLVKKVYVDGKPISSELVSKDKYIPAFKVIKRGTKMPEVMPEIFHNY